MRIILASQSPYRREQLKNFGLPYEAHSPRVDEEALKKIGPQDHEELTRFLALEKGKGLHEKFPQALIISADQLAECEGRRLDKPGTPERAIEQLTQLSGKEHRLITSLVLLQNDQKFVATDITRIRLKNLDRATIETYVAKDSPLDCAGSYKIEKAGLGLVASMATSDPSAIQGLPLLSLIRGLQEMGISLANLWGQQ